MHLQLHKCNYSPNRTPVRAVIIILAHYVGHYLYIYIIFIPPHLHTEWLSVDPLPDNLADFIQTITLAFIRGEFVQLGWGPVLYHGK